MVMDNSLSPTTIINLQSSFTFSWITRFSYLGIFLTLTFNNLHKANYPPLICALGPLLRTCTQYQNSCLERLNATKMRFLLKLLYYFQVLPISLPMIVLRVLHNKIMKFIWNTRKPKINKHTLYWNKPSGGLVVPPLLHYDRVAELAPIHFVCNSEVPFSEPLDTIDCNSTATCISSWMGFPPTYQQSSIAPHLEHSLRV